MRAFAIDDTIQNLNPLSEIFDRLGISFSPTNDGDIFQKYMQESKPDDILIRAPRFLTFSGRGSGARRLEMGVMPPVSALVRYGVFDAFPVARGVSYRTT